MPTLYTAFDLERNLLALRPTGMSHILENEQESRVGLEILAIIASVLAIAVSIYLGVQLGTLRQKFKTALGDGDSDSLAHLLAANHARMKEVSRRLEELEEEYQRLIVTNRLASQKITIVRLNPFGDTGGDQSFSLAVLDAHDSGYVLTSIHGRQGTRVYSKPVDYGKSKYSLSAEEQQALSQAAKRVPQADKPGEKST